MNTKLSEDESSDTKKKELRFKEIHHEREGNLEWLNSNNEDKEVFFAEIRETDENFEACQKAKMKEMNNFEYYKVFEVVEDRGQTVLGTRFVLLTKQDGSIKARFLIKGFQEEHFQLDSPTAS